jgi:hypothetical protein
MVRWSGARGRDQGAPSRRTKHQGTRIMDRRIALRAVITVMIGFSGLPAHSAEPQRLDVSAILDSVRNDPGTIPSVADVDAAGHRMNTQPHDGSRPLTMEAHATVEPPAAERRRQSADSNGLSLTTPLHAPSGGQPSNYNGVGSNGSGNSGITTAPAAQTKNGGLPSVGSGAFGIKWKTEF